MLTAVNAGRMTICDYVTLSAANPAKVFGLYPRKGVIAPGAEADIAVVDLKREIALDDATLQSRAKVTPWHGRKVTGPADPHAGARALRDARPRAGRRHARPWPLGARDPAHERARPAQHRPDHGLHHPRAGAANRRAPHERERRLRQAGERHGALRARGRACGARARRDQPAHRPWRLHRAGRPVGLRQVDHPQAGRRADPRVAAAMSTSRAARSAPSRCASAWRSRIRRCCRG